MTSEVSTSTDAKLVELEPLVTSQRETNSTAITVGITRHYGKISIELGATIYVEAASFLDFNAAYNELYDRVIDEHRIIAAKLAATSALSSTSPQPNGTAPQPSAAPAVKPATAGGDETFLAETLSIEKRNGKRYYSVRGGRWQKFGVRLWPDAHILQNLDWDITALPEGDHMPPRPLTAIIEMRDEKPVKVRALIDAVQEELAF